MIIISNSPFSNHVFVYELGCYKEEFGPLSHREEYATKKAAISAAKRLIKEHEYIELTLLEKDEFGYMIEGNVIETFYNKK